MGQDIYSILCLESNNCGNSSDVCFSLLKKLGASHSIGGRDTLEKVTKGYHFPIFGFNFSCEVIKATNAEEGCIANVFFMVKKSLGSQIRG